VPPPHIGSSSGWSNFQPVSMMIPAARFSRSGASGDVHAPAALEQRLARGVEVEHALRFFEESVDPHVGRGAVDVGAASELVAESGRRPRPSP
jgi:hypothetical protein